MSESSESQVFVVVGAGQAGAEVCSELRRQGFVGRIVLIGNEAFIPYKRPPLSKAYLAGTATEEQLYVMQQPNFDKLKIEFIGDTNVTQIDRADKQVHLADGRKLSYDKLALATGGRARPLPLPGAEAPNVMLLRSITDVQSIRAYCQPGKRMVVIGGGFIGLETAAVAVKLGLQVTVLEGLPRVLARVTVPEVSSFFERVHREAGVDLRTEVQIERLETADTGLVIAVQLVGGARIECDFIIIGIGVIANTELAASAGLEVENGIVVDEHTQTSDADIVAAGDCTNHPSTYAGRRLRLESVQNAMEQGRAAARSMLGKAEPYRMVPWFWSDQYDLKLQMVGLSAGFDQMVVRGDPVTQRSFAIFYLREGRMLAADAVSRASEFMMAKKWVGEGAKLDPAELADESIPLKSLLPVV